MGNLISQGSAEGRVAVITGGASGIGLGVAEHCAKLGMKICIADLERQEAEMADIEPMLTEMGAQGVMFHATDVATYESVEALRDAVYEKWDDVGFLFNNAGLGAGQAGFDGSWDASKQSLENWRLVIDVDLFGVLHGQQAFIPTMLERGTEAVVVNTASAAGLSNTAYTPNGTTDMAYTVAKNGVTLLSESLNAAMRHREAPISVHVLCPFGTQSSMGLNTAKYHATGMDEETRRKAVEMAEKRVQNNADAPGTGGQITAESGARMLQECIEVGRFYCVTPDRTASTNTSRAWMLARAEDFIADNPPFTSAPGTPAFRELNRDVSGRSRGPIHRWDGPDDAPSPYAGRRIGEGEAKARL